MSKVASSDGTGRIPLQSKDETIVERLTAIENALHDVAEPCLGLATLFNQDGHMNGPDPGWMIGVATILRKLWGTALAQISELAAVISDIEDVEEGGAR